PYVCGIDYATSCPRCQANWAAQFMDDREKQGREKWESLRHRHWPILRSQSNEPPGPPPDEVLMNLAIALFSPSHRDLLREIILDLIGNDIADIAPAISQGKTH